MEWEKEDKCRWAYKDSREANRGFSLTALPHTHTVNCMKRVNWYTEWTKLVCIDADEQTIANNRHQSRRVYGKMNFLDALAYK